MDQLALQSTFAKVRNGYGLRRWAYMDGSDAPTLDFRLSQLFGHSGQPYGENNAPMLTTRVARDETVAQLIPFRDNWERPATRWVKGVLSGGNTFTVLSGTPYLAEDPFQTTVQYKAKAGDDFFLDDGAGNVVVTKIASVSAAGNSVTLAPKQGVSIPANGTYYAKHTLDAFLVRLTVSYMVPTSQASILDPGTQANPFQSLIQVTYYDNSGSEVVEQYERVPVRELSTITTDVPYAFIDVVGDRFDTPTAPATPFIQVFEVFEFQMARVPDKMEVLFDNTGPTGGGTTVELGNVAVYYGANVPAAAQVPPNIFPPNPNPAPTTRYNLYPPPDPEDFWTGSGDIVVMPVGTQCPVGFEDITQVLSRANDHYVIDRATGRPIVFSVSNGNALTISLVGGNTKFDGTIPVTAEDPNNPNVSLRSATNNTSTFEIVFPLYLANGAFADHQLLTFRIPEIQFSSGGSFTFTLAGDLISRIQATATQAFDCLLLMSGIAKAGSGSIANAGKYEKPVQDDEDAVPVDDTGAGLAPYDDRVGLPLDEVFVSVGDILEFVDEDGIPLPGIVVGPDTTGPDFVVTAIDTDEGTVTVIDRQLNDTPPAPLRTTEVWRFVGDGLTPSTPIPNFYKVYTANTAHTHAIGTGDAEEKSRKDDGSFVTAVGHVHTVPAQAIIVPYVGMKLCVKL
jgi:hypothetical protein